MTRNEAIERARRMRDILGEDYIISSPEIIDALLASPWKEISEDMPRKGAFLIRNSWKGITHFCYYNKGATRWMVTDIFSVNFTFNDLRKEYTHWMEIPPVD